MNKKQKHQHNPPYHKVKIIENLLADSDIGKMKWHRIFGMCLVLRPYDDNDNTVIKSNHKHIQIYNEVDKKWIDMFGNDDDGKITTVVSRITLFDDIQDDDEQINLVTRIRVIS